MLIGKRKLVDAVGELVCGGNFGGEVSRDEVV